MLALRDEEWVVFAFVLRVVGGISPVCEGGYDLTRFYMVMNWELYGFKRRGCAGARARKNG
jgi:hypothetical protein